MRCAAFPAGGPSQCSVTAGPLAWYVRFSGAGGPCMPCTYEVGCEYVEETPTDLRRYIPKCLSSSAFVYDVLAAPSR